MRDHSVSETDDQDHEFELVLGNKQLFSVLFIVFVLLGVFFAMGYVMGRSSGPLDTASQKSGTAAGPESIPSPRRSAAEGTVPPAQSEQEAARPVATSGGTPATATDSPAAAAAVRLPDPPPITVTEPGIGKTYLQVSAVAKPEAELLVEVLIKKGFKAIVAPGPTEKLFRVLVGPSIDDADVAKTRNDLEQAGFKPIPRRY